jgi:preprotein translocase subunit SecE
MSSLDKIKSFLSEVRTETKKVTWPKMTELRDSTKVVVVSVFIITAFISVVDLFLNKVLRLFMQIGS